MFGTESFQKCNVVNYIGSSGKHWQSGAKRLDASNILNYPPASEASREVANLFDFLSNQKQK